MKTIRSGRTLPAILLPALALTACGDGAPEYSDGELQPGQWELRMEVTDFDLPNADESAKELARAGAGIGTTEEVANCLSPEEAAKGMQELADTFMEGSACTVSSFSTTGGQIAGQMSCTMPEVDTPMKVALSGTYSPQDFELVMDSTIEGEALPGGKATMQMVAKAERTGDC